MISVIEKLPEAEVYQHLRIACGLSPKSNTAVRIGLAATLFTVMAMDKNEPI